MQPNIVSYQRAIAYSLPQLILTTSIQCDLVTINHPSTYVSNSQYNIKLGWPATVLCNLIHNITQNWDDLAQAYII